MSVSRLDYCQYLVATQINYTLTNFADHAEGVSHDTLNRYLKNDRLTPRMVWENVREDIVPSVDGYLVFDDSLLDKNASHKIEMVKKQYSGNVHGVIKGIGFVTCIYVNPETEQYWALDFRVYDPASDGKTKLDHVRDMFHNVVLVKQLAFRTVLMDTWYAAKESMLAIETQGKHYCCPIRENRMVDDSGGETPYQRVDSLNWSEEEQERGKTVKIKGFPKTHKVRLFRVADQHRTEWVVTNDPSLNSLQAAQKACGLRWKIEQFHRELKQLTGIEACQCRKARIQRNHIACAVLAWIGLARVARSTGQSLYQVKYGQMNEYLRGQLKSPTVRFRIA